MVEEIISGVILSEFHEELGPNPEVWHPPSFDQTKRMMISIKTITMLTGEGALIPKEMVILPFPSLNSKGLIKYIQWEEEGRRGGIGQAAITLLFREFDDLIFYKYKDDLKPLFHEIEENYIGYKLGKIPESVIKERGAEFYEKIVSTLDQLKKKEEAQKRGVEFPDEEQKKEEAYDYRFKVIVCGDPAVGKTSTVLQFTRQVFSRTYLPTIGTNINEKVVEADGVRVQLVVWDVAGQSKFQTMRKHFYQGAEGIFLVFDLAYRKSFESIPKWHSDITKYLQGKNVTVIYLVGNKADLVDERKVEREEAEQLAQELGAVYIETSAKTGENINDSFIQITKALLKKHK